MEREQRVAFARLRALAAPLRLRVVADDEGWPAIPGRLGHIEHYDDLQLAVYTDRPKMFARVWAVPGARRYQTADTEIRALFPPAALEQVVQVIRARRRRAQTSPASLGNLRPRATSGRREASFSWGAGKETVDASGGAAEA